MTKNKGDLISREALKTAVADHFDNLNAYFPLKFIEEIDNAPPVKTYCYFCGQTEHGKIEERPQGEWIPITMRKLTPEEIRECNERYGADIGDEARAYNCRLPEDGQEVLITTAWGAATIDTFHADPDDCFFEDHEDADEVIAWRPLPDAYDAERGPAS